MSILVVILVLCVAVLALAWYDAGREEQRLVVEPVMLPEAAR
ncbi:hypothetical protein [Alteraurantiacibacter aestuarii]